MKYTIIEILAKDVTFIEEADAFFKDLFEKAKTSFVKKYLNKTLRPYLIEHYPNIRKKTHSSNNDPDWMKKKIAKGEDVFVLESFSQKHKDYFNKVLEYLNSLPSNKEIKIEARKLPLLIKAKKDKEYNDKIRSGNEEGTEVVIEYSKGFTWKKIFSKEALHREGTIMQHCVKSEDYFNEVSQGKCEIYSLRDRSNNPHVTIEISNLNKPNRDLVQIRGKQNLPPIQKYLFYVDDFLHNKQINIRKPNLTLLREQCLLYIGKKLYSKYSIPENSIIEGNLGYDKEIYGTKLPIPELPNNLTIKGSLLLNGIKIEKLPDNLVVEDDLDISFTKITELPDTLKFGRNLNIKYTKIIKLPDNLTIRGGLNLSNTNITELPNNLTINTLEMERTKITKLPDNLTVNDDLDITDTNIDSLGNNILVNGNFRANGIVIKSIGKNVKCNGNLEGSNLICLDNNLYINDDLPDNLTVNEDVNLTLIDKLPNNLTINGNLTLENCYIKEIPDNLTVNGRLDIYRCSDIKKIGKNIKYKYINTGESNLLAVSNNLYLINQLPDNLTIDVMELDLSNSKLEKLPDNLTINGDLNASWTKLKSLPKNLVVNGNLNLSYNEIKEIPESISVSGDLNISNNNLEKLPDNMVIKGDLDIQYNPISILPDNLNTNNLTLCHTNIRKLPDDLKVKNMIFIEEDVKIDCNDELKKKIIEV